jgi:hypothetical protein
LLGSKERSTIHADNCPGSVTSQPEPKFRVEKGSRIFPEKYFSADHFKNDAECGPEGA